MPKEKEFEEVKPKQPKQPKKLEKSKSEKLDEEIAVLEREAKRDELLSKQQTGKTIAEREEAVKARETDVAARETAVQDKENLAKGKEGTLTSQNGELKETARQQEEITRQLETKGQTLTEALNSAGPVLRQASNIQQVFAKARKYIEEICSMTQNSQIVPSDERRSILKKDFSYLLRICENPISEEFIESEEKILQEALRIMRRRYS